MKSSQNIGDYRIWDVGFGVCGVGCRFLEFGFRRIIVLPTKAATGISGYRRSQNIECSVLQCVAVCCSVLQCVAVWI